jgi:hypothetical protein
LTRTPSHPPYPKSGQAAKRPRSIASGSFLPATSTSYRSILLSISDHRASAWLVAKDISKLQIHEIEAYISEPYKRSGDLLQGYRIALDPKKWEEELEQAGFEAGEAEADAEIDQLESEAGDDRDKKAARPKKRKRESEAGLSRSKLRIKVDKGSERRKSGSKGKRNGNKLLSKDMVESEDDGEGGGPSNKGSPPTKKAKRDKDDDEDCRYSSVRSSVRS